MTRKQRVTRVVFGVYVVVVAAFVVSNIAQVASALFGGTAAAAEASGPTVGPACGKSLNDQLVAIDKALLAASSEPNDEAARARYASERRAARSPELEQSCAADPAGTDALAALARFDRAAESHAVRTVTELRSVRMAAQSFIRGPR
ncbi:MAG: hypothetical protein K0S65_6427 [Labilithrix sp.]|nr:hypothetical protein [Labilithrix sp.]